MDLITSHIAIGDCHDPENCKDSYDSILNTAAEIPRRRGGPGLHMKLRDREPIPNMALDRAFRFLDSQLLLGRIVLVHCGGGTSRSVSVVCGYLAHRIGLSPEEVLGKIRLIRPAARPDRKLFESVVQYVKTRPLSSLADVDSGSVFLRIRAG